MVGHYLNKKTKYLECLANWKNAVIQGELWEKFDDLHINEIDHEFEDPKLWVDGGLFLYDCLLKLIDRNIYNCILCIPLLDSSGRTDWYNINVDYLKRELDLTPPSFYLFPKGSYNYEQTIRESVLLENLSKQLDEGAYFKKILVDNVYSRTVYVTGKT